MAERVLVDSRISILDYYSLDLDLDRIYVIVRVIKQIQHTM